LYNDWQWSDVDDDFAEHFFHNVIAKQYESGGGIMAVFLKENETYIGHCGVKYVASKGEWYLSFRFIKSFWKSNYPTESVETCLKWAFAHLKINEIVVDLEEKNKGAAKTLEKVGFKLRFTFEENDEQMLRFSVFS
jgi:[ribosomal protein S5]-alanine N-acetyltransferase